MHVRSNAMAEPEKRIDPSRIIKSALIILMLLFIAVMLMIYFAFPDENAVPSVFGTKYHILVNHSDNMEPKIMENEMILAVEAEGETIERGSVVVCDFGGTVSLLRVNEIRGSGASAVYQLHADKAAKNETITATGSEVILVAKKQNVFLGKFILFASSTMGVRLSIIIPCLIIVIYQIIRILKIRKLEEQADLLGDFENFDGFVSKKGASPQAQMQAARYASPSQTQAGAKLTVTGSGKAEYKRPAAQQSSVAEFERSLAKTGVKPSNASAAGKPSGTNTQVASGRTSALASPSAGTRTAARQPARTSAPSSPLVKPISQSSLERVTKPQTQYTEPPIISLTKPIDKDELERAVISSASADNVRKSSFMEKYNESEKAEFSAPFTPKIPVYNAASASAQADFEPVKSASKAPPAPMSESELVRAIAEVKAKKAMEAGHASDTDGQNIQAAQNTKDGNSGTAVHTGGNVPAAEGTKEPAKAAPAAVKKPASSIPKMAVKPSENIAPPPKKSSNKTVEDLMKVIDRAEAKMKK